MNRRQERQFNGVLIFLISALIFYGITMPFRNLFSVMQVTEIRPAAALNPVLGIVFGFPGAFGCAVGNLVADLVSGYGWTSALWGFIPQFLYGFVPHVAWRLFSRSNNRINNAKSILKYYIIILLNAILMALTLGIIMEHLGLSPFWSANTLFILLNNIDFCILLGLPIYIGLVVGKEAAFKRQTGKNTMIRFSINEKMVLNTVGMVIVVGVLVGGATYLASVSLVREPLLSLFNRIYISVTIALNVYFVFSFGTLFFIEKQFVKPIEKLAKISSCYYAPGVGERDRSLLINETKKYTADKAEVGDLARSFVSMHKDLKKYIANIQSITAEQERVNAELSLATNIQTDMLPRIFPAFPEHLDFDIYATMNPAKEVGGDFYDFFMINNHTLGVVIADVSGKGVPAALFMVIAKTIIKNHAQLGLRPEEVFTTANAMLCEGNDAGLFVTGWMAYIDLNTGEMTCVNAGHNPPVLLHDGEYTYLKMRPGFVLAGMEGMKYHQTTFRLNRGDKLFLYTDGITEATSLSRELYGEDRLLFYLNGHKTASVYETLQGVTEDVNAFVGEAEQFDDMTMLCFDYSQREIKNDKK